MSMSLSSVRVRLAVLVSLLVSGPCAAAFQPSIMLATLPEMPDTSDLTAKLQSAEAISSKTGLSLPSIPSIAIPDTSGLTSKVQSTLKSVPVPDISGATELTSKVQDKVTDTLKSVPDAATLSSKVQDTIQDTIKSVPVLDKDTVVSTVQNSVTSLVPEPSASNRAVQTMNDIYNRDYPEAVSRAVATSRQDFVQKLTSTPTTTDGTKTFGGWVQEQFAAVYAAAADIQAESNVRHLPPIPFRELQSALGATAELVQKSSNDLTWQQVWAVAQVDTLGGWYLIALTLVSMTFMGATQAGTGGFQRSKSVAAAAARAVKNSTTATAEMKALVKSVKDMAALKGKQDEELQVLKDGLATLRDQVAANKREAVGWQKDKQLLENTNVQQAQKIAELENENVEELQAQVTTMTSQLQGKTEVPDKNGSSEKKTGDFFMTSDWSSLSSSALKRKTVRELATYLESKGVNVTDKTGNQFKKAELLELIVQQS